ncbi:MAG TPA: nucleotide exchange factor GrpE [Verrucomicrobiota bacterium]|nr:nucleotide exchange factor GrpE [Verrucomicrobiales bacterium]HRI13060.1 nucleotide exchange factor GrpE [Verrucomicrobiota bacterium]
MSASPIDTDADPSAQAAGEETTVPDAEAQLAAAQDRLLRLAADFENFKKRAARDRDDARRVGAESVLGKLLPVLDNFDMAMAAAAQSTTTLDTLRVGVNMIHGQLRGLLSDLGVKEIDPVGQPFDPSLHEAVSVQQSSEVPEGHVAQLTRKGYQLGDRLLRPASVVVATKSDSENNPS